jgi:hypothetical protein
MNENSITRIPPNMLPLLNKFSNKEIKGMNREEARKIVISYLKDNGVDVSTISTQKLNRVVDGFLEERMENSRTLGQTIINIIGGLGIIASVSIPSTLENKTLAVLGTSIATIMTQNAVHLSQNKAKRDLEEGR